MFILKESNIVFGQIFDSEEYETKRREAVLSVVGAHAFIDYLFDVLEGQKKNESRSDNVVEQLKDYIEQNLNEDLSRSVLAGKVFLSEDYVSKIFMKTTGMSLPNYIAERRIERAKEYLRSSSLPISKIAMEVGYGILISVKRSGSWSDVHQMSTGADKNNKKTMSITKKRSD